MIIFAASNILTNKKIILAMAYHKSSEKRIRQTETKKEKNRYYARSTRNAIKNLRSTTKKEEASVQLPKVASMLDKLAKKTSFMPIRPQI